MSTPTRSVVVVRGLRPSEKGFITVLNELFSMFHLAGEGLVKLATCNYVR